MSKDPFDDPDLKAYLRRAEREVFPKMKASTISLAIAGDPDPKLCLELGAMILFDKPIIVLVPNGRQVPANLKRVASAIVHGDMSDPTTTQRLQKAIGDVLRNDVRSKKQ